MLNWISCRWKIRWGTLTYYWTQIIVILGVLVLQSLMRIVTVSSLEPNCNYVQRYSAAIIRVRKMKVSAVFVVNFGGVLPSSFNSYKFLLILWFCYVRIDENALTEWEAVSHPYQSADVLFPTSLQSQQTASMAGGLVTSAVNTVTSFWRVFTAKNTWGHRAWPMHGNTCSPIIDCNSICSKFEFLSYYYVRFFFFLILQISNLNPVEREKKRKQNITRK